MLFKSFAKNTEGRDFICGDIHGCFTELEDLLAKVDFDPRVDRLFCTGDLVDRGEESHRSLEFLAKPWFHTVRGNHEQMAIDFVNGLHTPYVIAYNGGMWFLALEQDEQLKFINEFAKLPVAIEVETSSGKIGIVHGEPVLENWEDIKLRLNTCDQFNINQFANSLMWSRNRFHMGATFEIKNIDNVFVGHTCVREIFSIANVTFIDTGIVFGNQLSLLQIRGDIA